MAKAVDLPVKKADGTTTITFNVLQASGGDKTPAMWRVEAANAMPALRPYFRIESRNNGNGRGRVVSGTLVYPETANDPVTGQSVVKTRAIADFSFKLDSFMTEAIAKDAAHILGNLLVSQLVRDTLVSGYSPTA